MKLKILFLSFFLLFSLGLLAQTTWSVKGVITDTAAKVNLPNTSVIVLNSKDSTLVGFTRTGKDGSFAVSNLHKGKFILLLIYPAYADYVEQFSLDSAKTSHDFGRLNMILKSKLLADVIIKAARVPIKIKGDTTEFNAKSYVIQPNDKVEDLLRQLPGIEVDKDGKITAQGQAVSKVLVDGEEFFGDDPTLVTKNIRADMVDKVQLYDKKSDQATFTGIDDGVRTKTINIKLKEDKKNGVFGKVNANIGTDDYYEGQLLFNKFKANEKFSAYATAANDGRTGLGFQDSNTIGAGSGDIQFVDGGISISGIGNSNDALDSFSGYYDGKGVPVTTSGGVHYDSHWNTDKQSFNANYKLGDITVTGTTTSSIQQTEATSTLNTYSNQTFNNYAFRQKLDATYQVKLDTTQTLKISADGTLRNFHVNNDYSTRTDSSSIALNRNNRSVINHGDTRIFDATAFYTKKFKKTGRTLSWSLSESYNQSETEGYLNSETDYYNASGKQDSTLLINQYKTTNNVSSVLNSNITYSEPLIKNVALLFNYGLAINNSTSSQLSFNPSTAGNYNLLDTAYSNDYKFNQLTNQLGAMFNYKTGKLIFNFGTKVSGVDFKQVDEYTGDELKRNFLNWAPQANFQYKFSQFRSFYLNYRGTTTQPTISQIQPVLVNTDPLNQTIGNQRLGPSFSNRFFMYYNNYQVISGQQFYVNANYSNTTNAIVNNTTENTGVNTTQYVNLPNKVPYNYSVYMNMGRKLTFLAGLQAGFNLNTSGNVSYSYINSALDQANSHTYSGGLSISKYVQKKYDFNINAGPSYTFSNMSLQPGANNNAAGFNSSGRFDLYLPLNFGAGSDVNYTYNAATQSFSAEYKTIWNAYVYKSFRKDESFKLSLSVNDLLNQNTNFTRGLSGNTSTQTNTTGIRRFVMLSLIWDFTKFGTLPAKN